MRFFIAFFISLLIYLLLLWLYFTQFSEIKVPPKKQNNHVIKIDIRSIPIPKFVPKKVEPIASVPPIVPLPPIIKKPKKKPVVKKKIIKKKPVKKKVIKPKEIKKVVKLKPKPIVKKIKPKKEIPVVEKEEIIYIEEPFLMDLNEPFEIIEESLVQPKKEVKEEVYERSDDLASFLGTPDRSVRNNNSHPNSKIKKLYGASFHTFTPTQKKFIENNLEGIQQITQNTLTRRGYPEGAGRTGQEGTNVVSFDLHPNGDISNLRLKQRIGYRSLDDNTLSLIKTAYKDYPYPSTTTKIVFYVKYSIYGY